MIITQTPFRISFFGGGTDYPEHFERHGGAVLGTAIDKSGFLTVMRFHSSLFDYSIRISYRQVECKPNIDQIEHAPFRECLKWCKLTRDIEVNYSAELPSFVGLGSSSSFVVGLLNSLYAFQGKSIPPSELAYQAIELEREVLHDCVGYQDQIFAAHGGFNLIEFRGKQDTVVNRVPLSPDRLAELEGHLLLVFTGIKRRAGKVAASQIKNITRNTERLKRMRAMVDRGFSILTGSGSLTDFGSLLHESWICKQELDSTVSNGQIREMYERGLAAGALGGKLLGAGGGGFLLFLVPPERRESLMAVFNDYEQIPIRLNAPGTHVIHAS
ncbi:MAG: GHMP kinase [Planctomycetes bacterium]|nr:GHMP kinase [Planctomycetota bacterium]